MSADAERDAVGLPMGDAHAAVIDAKNFAAHLRHHRLESLAKRCAAGDQLDRA